MCVCVFGVRNRMFLLCGHAEGDSRSSTTCAARSRATSDRGGLRSRPCPTATPPPRQQSALWGLGGILAMRMAFWIDVVVVATTMWTHNAGCNPRGVLAARAKEMVKRLAGCRTAVPSLSLPQARVLASIAYCSHLIPLPLAVGRSSRCRFADADSLQTCFGFACAGGNVESVVVSVDLVGSKTKQEGRWERCESLGARLRRRPNPQRPGS